MGRAAICLEIDGVLSPTDSLREAARLLPNGDRLYDRLAQYEALLIAERSPGVEPGSRLAYLAPFLLRHGIRDDDLALAQPPLAPGAARLLGWLRRQGWTVFLVTVALRARGEAFARRFHIPSQQVVSTTLSVERLHRYREFVAQLDMDAVGRLEDDLLRLSPADDEGLREITGGFLAWPRQQPAGGLLAAVKPMGGHRKSQALRSLSHTFGVRFEDVAVVGILPLDRQIMARVDYWGGLAVLRGVPEGPVRGVTAALESADLTRLIPVLEAWAAGGRVAVRERVEAGDSGVRWLAA